MLPSEALLSEVSTDSCMAWDDRLTDPSTGTRVLASIAIYFNRYYDIIVVLQYFNISKC